MMWRMSSAVAHGVGLGVAWDHCEKGLFQEDGVLSVVTRATVVIVRQAREKDRWIEVCCVVQQ